jgi:hypothetical protein
MKRLALVAAVSLMTGCAALEREVILENPDGTVTETTVGDIIADSATPAGEAVGTVVTGFTANPMLGGGAAALAAGLLAGLRRKKKPATTPAEPTV